MRVNPIADDIKTFAASSWHTAALTMRLLVKTLPIKGGIIGAGFEEFRWPRPPVRAIPCGWKSRR